MCDVGLGHACVALIDTGTSFIGVPANFYDTFLHRVTSARPDCIPHGTTQIMTCSSTSTHSLPSLAFTLSASHTYTLEPADYLTDHTIGIMPLHTSLHGSASSVQLFILGDTFLRCFYTVFDMESGAIGIANGKNVRVEESGWRGWRMWHVVVLVACLAFALCLLGICAWRMMRWWRESGAMGGMGALGGGSGGVRGAAAARASLWVGPGSGSMSSAPRGPQGMV